MPAQEISSFDDLLRVAREQPQPQRLLFVFAGAELPEDSTPGQRRRFEAGEGGALVPLMCVDKAPAEISGFSALAEEARMSGPQWTVVFVAALAGTHGVSFASQQIEASLQRMVDAIKSGAHDAFIPFDHDGLPVHFEPHEMRG